MTRIGSISVAPACIYSAAAEIEGRRHRRFRIAHPVVNPRQDKHELVLDADDLVVGFVPDHSAPIIALGHAGFAVFLSAGIGLAAWFSLGASVREFKDARRILGRLKGERKSVQSWQRTAPKHLPFQVAKQRMAEAMLLQNKAETSDQKTRAVFSGPVIGLGAAAEIYGYLTSPYLLGLTAGVATSGVIALTVAVPLISAFAAANAYMQFCRAYRAVRDRRFVPLLAHQNPWPENIFHGGEFVKKRLHRVRNHAAVTGLGFTGIAVGVPLTFWGGGYGLGLLAPAIVTVAAANHYESHKIEYKNPMSFKGTFALVLERQVLNEMGLAAQEYAFLKRLKNEKRADYLTCSHHGRFVKAVTAPIRSVKRLIGHAPHSGEESKYTLYRYFGEQLALSEHYWQYKYTALSKHQHEDDHELRHLLREARRKMASVPLENDAWRREWLKLPTLSPAVRVKRLCDVVVQQGLFEHFALRIARDAVLRKPFHVAAQGHTSLKSGDIIAYAQRDVPSVEPWTRRLFDVAEDMFLTTLKDWRRSRAWEMADLAVNRKRAKFVLEKEAAG